MGRERNGRFGALGQYERNSQSRADRRFRPIPIRDRIWAPLSAAIDYGDRIAESRAGVASLVNFR